MAFGKGLNSLFQPSGGNYPSRGNNVPPPPHIIHEEEIMLRPFNRNVTPIAREKEYHSKQARTEPHQKQESVFLIEAERIKPNPYQPRSSFDSAEIEGLANSIREFGVLQPIIVSKIVKESDTGTFVEYQLIAGERRLMAAKRARLERIPAIIRKVDAPKLKLELALIENLQRSNLNALEAAKAYVRLQEEFGLTQKEIAERVGKSRESVANTMRLLSLPQYVQNAISNGNISESHARHLISLSPEAQKDFFERLLKEGMSAHKVREKIVLEKSPDPEKGYLERKFEERFGVPVSITKHGEKGKIMMQFYSEEQYRALIKELLKDEEPE